MKAIGFRAGSREVHYAVIEGNSRAPTLVTIDKLAAPAAYTQPQMLVWYREQCQLLIDEFGTRAGGVKTAEPLSRSLGAAARRGATDRNNLEGVIMEAVAAKGCDCIVGSLATLSSKIGERPGTCLDSERFQCIATWAKLNREKKEAVLAAVSALAMLEAK